MVLVRRTLGVLMQSRWSFGILVAGIGLRPDSGRWNLAAVHGSQETCWRFSKKILCGSPIHKALFVQINNSAVIG